jgi:hypothetical protein
LLDGVLQPDDIECPEEPVSFGDRCLRLILRETDGAERYSGLEGGGLDPGDRVKECRMVELTENIKLGRQIKRSDDHAIDAFDRSDFLDILQSTHGLDQEHARGISLRIGRIFHQMTPLTN